MRLKNVAFSELLLADQSFPGAGKHAEGDKLVKFAGDFDDTVVGERMVFGKVDTLCPLAALPERS